MRIATGLFLILIAWSTPSLAQMQTPCGIPAYPNPAVPTGLSSLGPNGQPIIFFNQLFFMSLGQGGQDLYRYMLAHECAHHQSGDVVAGMMDPMGMLTINPVVELRADCGAAQYLKSVGDVAALAAAIQYWASFGNMPTGPNYPTGFQRAQALNSC
jgi:hypothetical protein